MKTVGNDLDFGGVARALNLPDPVAAQQAATKAYVDSAVEGLAWKDSARVSTQANLNLAAPGAAIDGINMAVNDRVLVRAQAAGVDNGLYIWNGAAVAMTRSLDANTAAELEQAIVTVEEGTSANASFRQTSVNANLGVTVINFVAFGTGVGAASEATAGIAELATQAEVDAGVDDARIVTPAKLAAQANRKLKFPFNIGDNAATQFIITHNLNTFDVLVEVFRNSGARDSIICDVDRPDANSVRLTFAAPPTLNQFRCVVLG